MIQDSQEPENSSVVENIAGSVLLLDDCQCVRETTVRLRERVRAYRSSTMPDPWPQGFAQERRQAEADYQEAVEQYLALVGRKNSAALAPSAYLQQLDTAKQAVDRFREYYYSLLAV